MSSQVDRLLRQVVRRSNLAALGGRWFQLTMAFGAGLAAFLLVSRLLGVLPGVLPGWQSLWVVLVVPVAAGLGAWVAHPRVGLVEAARRVDRRVESKDLFLTAAMLDRSVGDYRSLVDKRAEVEARRVRPAEVVPFRGWPRAGQVVGVLVLLAAGVAFLPELDPFHLQAAEAKRNERQAALEKEKALTDRRLAELRAEQPEAPLSEQVQQSVEQLRQTFDQMKRETPKVNLAKLQEQQQLLGQEWRKAGEKRLQESFKSQSTQRFGSRSPQTEQWKKQLQAGDPAGMRKALDELQQMAKKLAQTDDPIERQAMQSEMRQRMEELSQALGQGVSSPGLDAAMNQVMSQLMAASSEGLSSEALEALGASLQLSQAELESLAQSMRDLQALEEALKTLQLAKQANASQPLDGSDLEGCQTMADYARMYVQWAKAGEGQCAACGGVGCSACNGTGRNGTGQGPGMGGAGMGTGSVAPEDPSLVTNYQPEKAQSAMTAGKVLLQWKTQGTADSGEARVEYRQMMQQVKQGVSEAILQEEVPPGYHNAIRGYFDAIDAESGK